MKNNKRINLSRQKKLFTSADRAVYSSKLQFECFENLFDFHCFKIYVLFSSVVQSTSKVKLEFYSIEFSLNLTVILSKNKNIVNI